jgi:hypothetical protein
VPPGRPPGSSPDEYGRLHHCIRDLASLNALPSTCIGRSPDEALDVVLAALPTALSCDLAYLELPGTQAMERATYLGAAASPAIYDTVHAVPRARAAQDRPSDSHAHRPGIEAARATRPQAPLVATLTVVDSPQRSRVPSRHLATPSPCEAVLPRSGLRPVALTGPPRPPSLEPRTSWLQASRLDPRRGNTVNAGLTSHPKPPRQNLGKSAKRATVRAWIDVCNTRTPGSPGAVPGGAQ